MGLTSVLLAMVANCMTYASFSDDIDRHSPQTIVVNVGEIFWRCCDKWLDSVTGNPWRKIDRPCAPAIEQGD